MVYVIIFITLYLSSAILLFIVGRNPGALLLYPDHDIVEGRNYKTGITYSHRQLEKVDTNGTKSKEVEDIEIQNETEFTPDTSDNAKQAAKSIEYVAPFPVPDKRF